MRRLLALLLLLLCVPPSPAHPGVGIVQDSRGNVYFTDLKQVWKITPDGKQSVAVAAVHTHELYLDADDNLFGEHLSYEGATQKWRHRVWRLKPDGTVSDIIPTTEGFRTEYSFVRDAKGAMFWAERNTGTVIKKRPPDGKPATHASGDLRKVGWMTATPDGTLYLMDSGDLRRVSPDGKITTVAAKLSGQQKPPAKVSDVNYHMGLWTDRDGLVYVAVAAERLVVRVTADGKSSVVAKSSDPWSPSGGWWTGTATCGCWSTTPTTRLARVGSARTAGITYSPANRPVGEGRPNPALQPTGPAAAVSMGVALLGRPGG